MKKILFIIIIALHQILFAQWEQVNVGIEDVTSYRAIEFIDELNGWVATNKGILKTADGGNNWSLLNDKLTLVTSMQFLDSLIGYATEMNNDSGVVKTIDGGNSWQALNIEYSYGFARVKFLNEKEGWIIRHYGTSILSTIDSGKTWKDLGPNGLIVSGFDIVNKDTIIVCGGFGNPEQHNGNTIIKSTYDGGEKWNEFTNPSSEYYWDEKPTSVNVLNQDYVWASDMNSVFYSDNSGLSWNQTNAIKPFGYRPATSVIGIDSLTCFAAGIEGVFITVNQGDYWHNQHMLEEGFITPNNGKVLGDSIAWFGGNKLYKNKNLRSLIDSLNSITNVRQESSMPNNFVLKQNYPNPFNPSTKIKYTIPIVETRHALSTNVKLEIFNTLGQKIKTLVNRPQQAGTYEVEFQANNLPSGVYYYRLQAGQYSETKKMLLLR